MIFNSENELRIGVIHAAAGAIEPLNLSLRHSVPNVKTITFLNEEMLQYVNKKGCVDSKALRMFATQVFLAEEAGCDLIIVGCNVFAPHTEKLLPFVSVPILAADKAMQEKAVRIGKTIGVIGTNNNAVPSCISGMKREAEKLGLPCPEFIGGTVLEAADALTHGNLELFDSLLATQAVSLAKQCDVIVLSQITMARAKPALVKEGVSVPILTTPEACAEEAAAILRKTAEAKQKPIS